MKGQWLGSYEGDASGKIMIDIDDVGDHYEGIASIVPTDRSLPASVAYFNTIDKHGDVFSVEAIVNAVDPRNARQVNWDEIKDLFGPHVSFAREINAKFIVSGNVLSVDVESKNGNFKANASRSKVGEISRIPGRPMSWAKFKDHVSSLGHAGFIFRGQQSQWSLCTSFHRRGRYRIDKFVNEDVKQLYQRIAGVTPHLFDLSVPEHNGAFLNLLQHHGYPTPLLDWSYSPYVAAFFAFRGWPIGYSGKEYSRIYFFNMKEWKGRYPQFQFLNPVFQHLSVTEFVSINNSRMVPQQSLTTVTNVHDIESYMLEKELDSGVEFLYAIDIPANERELAMADLRFMGITAGSMFPGIDGICEELRERNFD